MAACVGPTSRPYSTNSSLHFGDCAGLEFRQKIYLSDGQVDLQNHLSVMKSTCPTQKKS